MINNFPFSSFSWIGSLNLDTVLYVSENKSMHLMYLACAFIIIHTAVKQRLICEAMYWVQFRLNWPKFEAHKFFVIASENV